MVTWYAMFSWHPLEGYHFLMEWDCVYLGKTQVGKAGTNGGGETVFWVYCILWEKDLFSIENGGNFCFPKVTFSGSNEVEHVKARSLLVTIRNSSQCYELDSNFGNMCTVTCTNWLALWHRFGISNGSSCSHMRKLDKKGQDLRIHLKVLKDKCGHRESPRTGLELKMLTGFFV